MSKQLSRREFLKTLGLFGGVTAFNFSVLQKNEAELAEIVKAANESRPAALYGRPFWVKQVSEVPLGMGVMTEEYKRFNPVKTQFGSFAKYVGEEKANELRALNGKNTAEWMKEGRPGYNLRDRAFANASNLLNMVSGPFGGDNVGIQSWQPMPWTMGLRKQAAELGVKYDVPPEIAARDVKAAARHFGSAITGITVIDKRLINSHHSSGREIVFEDAEQPYSDEEKFVIPNSFKYAITLASRMPVEAHLRTPSAISSGATRLGYSEMAWVSGNLAEFIRGLGYHAIPMKNDFCSTVAFGVLSGVGELGRTNRLVTPEYGTLVRLSVVLTDLPLAVDSPIDAGISQFCVRCKKCAEACPSGALSMEDEPTFDVPEGYEWVNPGHKAWWPDQRKCYSYWQEITTGCGTCFSVCPWSKKDKAWLHDMVKITAATTPAFDSFFRTMDDAFGFEVKNSDQEQDAWWELDLPEYGIDTTQGHRSV